MTRLIQNKKGMTLVEMVVGMIIASAFMVLIVQTYTVTMRMSQTCIQQVEQLEEGQLILEQVSRDLHSVVNQYNSLQLITQSTTGQKNHIKFVRMNESTDAISTVVEEVNYSLGTSNRIYRNSLSQNSSANRPLGIGLTNTNYTMQFECYGNVTSANPWVTEWVNQNSLPNMVKVTLKLQNTKISNNQLKLTRTIRIGEL